jgi:predicted alpha/beta-fold hydrolase
VPFNLEAGVARLNRGFSRAYQYRLLCSLIQSTHAKFKHKPEPPVTLSTLHRMRTLRDYDNQITAPLHGFAGADDYYRQSSSRQFLKDIRIPTLIIHAADDPFMTKQMIPTAHELSSYITFELSEYGGHIGFVSGRYPWNTHYWLESRIPAYLEAALR